MKLSRWWMSCGALWMPGVGNKMKGLALFWERCLSAFCTFYCCWSFVILPWPSCLPKISQLLAHNTPVYIPWAPAVFKRSYFQGSGKELIRNIKCVAVSFCSNSFAVFVECVLRCTATLPDILTQVNSRDQWGGAVRIAFLLLAAWMTIGILCSSGHVKCDVFDFAGVLQ